MNSSDIKVSVIIPVFNTEKYLPECLNSVLNQTLRNIEVICVDDKSTDQSGSILDEYGKRDGRITVFHLKWNQRQGHARNYGMDRARGKYIYFLDSDDMIEPETLEELSTLADRDNLDAIFFDNKEKYENEDLKKIYVPPFSLREGEYRDEVVTGNELMEEFLRNNEWTCYPQRIFWRKEFLRQNDVRYKEGCEHEDEYFAFAGIITAKRVRYLRKQYFTLRIRPNSVMTSPKSSKNFHGYLMNFYYMNEFVADRGLHTYGAEAGVAIIFNCLMTLYKSLKDKYDLEASFAEKPDKLVYQHFMDYIRLEFGENGVYAMDSERLEEIRKYRVAYVYGVDYFAREVCERLERHNVLIGGFLAKELENTPSVLMGRRVLEFDETEIPNDAVVVVSAKPGVWEEIRPLLTKRNIRYVRFVATAPSWTNY